MSLSLVAGAGVGREQALVPPCMHALSISFSADFSLLDLTWLWILDTGLGARGVRAWPGALVLCSGRLVP